MDKKLFSLFVDVESLPFWLERPVLRKRMRQVHKYIKRLEAGNDNLHRQNTHLKVEQDNRIKELEVGALQVVADSNKLQLEAAQRIKELEAEKGKLAESLLRIDNYCRVNDIDMEQALKG